ncbi:MAG: M20/M25/M40 family metallo-hydrolase, partial [Sandaracinaceae bacterium]
LADARLTVDGGVHRPPMVAPDASRALMRRYAAPAEAGGLGAPEAPRQGGGSDANLLAAAGVPCIDGLGPWGQGAHRTSEWCSLDSLRRRTEALARFLARTSAVTDEP